MRIIPHLKRSISTDGVGFEPTHDILAYRFSRAIPLATWVTIVTGRTGFEPATPSTGNLCSIQLS